MSKPIKRNKTKFENLIRTIWVDTKQGKIICNNEQKMVIAAIQRTMEHFSTDDYLYGTNYFTMFKTIYLEPLSYNKTKKCLSNVLYIGEATLTRITNTIIRCFEAKLQDAKCDTVQINQNLIVLHEEKLVKLKCNSQMNEEKTNGGN